MSALYERELPDGRVISVDPMIFSYRINVGDGATFYARGFCYPRDLGLPFVLACAEAWDGTGDPLPGWIKEAGTQRYRPGGDPQREFIQR